MRRDHVISGGVIALALTTGNATAGRAAGTSPPPLERIAPATCRSVIAAAAQTLREAYIFPESADAMAHLIQSNQEKGKYREVADGAALAAMLTTDLREVSHDQHLEVRFSPTILPAELEPPAHADQSGSNFGLRKAERLDGNVGLLEIDYLADPASGGETAVAAMTFLSNTDALIVDLRYCGGGSGRMVRLLLTYLFDSEPVHLNDYRSRGPQETVQSWTLPYVPGRHLAGKPVYVLTSARTFSAAEEFAYDLQSLGRATIVGERTRGGAHPVKRFRIDDHFAIQVPVTRTVNPITGTDWEGTGVQPGKEVPASDALVVARRLALERLIQDHPDDALVGERRNALAELAAVPLPSAIAAAEAAGGPEVFARCAGRYQTSHGVLIARREGNGLRVEIGGEPAGALVLEGPLRFGAPDVGAHLTFVADPDGRMNAVAVEVGGETISGRRIE